MTFANIRTEVRTYLDEATAADWTDAQLNRFINDRYLKLIQAVEKVFEGYYIISAVANSVADQQEYQLPSDFKRMRRVEIDYDPDNSDSTPQRALPINIDEVRRDLGQTNIGVTFLRRPIYYIVGGEGSNANMGFVPIPDEASSTGDEAIKIWYVPRQDELSADADDPKVPDEYQYLIAIGATADALRKGQQEMDAADRFEAKYDREVLKMQEELEDRVTEESKHIVDTSAWDIGWSWR